MFTSPFADIGESLCSLVDGHGAIPTERYVHVGCIEGLASLVDEISPGFRADEVGWCVRSCPDHNGIDVVDDDAVCLSDRTHIGSRNTFFLRWQVSLCWRDGNAVEATMRGSFDDGSERRIAQCRASNDEVFGSQQARSQKSLRGGSGSIEVFLGGIILVRKQGFDPVFQLHP